MKYRPHQPVPQLLNLSEADARKPDEMGLTVRVLRPGNNVITADLRNDRSRARAAWGRELRSEPAAHGLGHRDLQIELDHADLLSSAHRGDT